MAQRRTPRTGPGPGRSGRRPGSDAARARARARTTTSRAATPQSAGSPGTPTSPASPVETAPEPRFARSIGITRRAVAMAVVLTVLLLSYASSLRIYLTQQSDAAQARVEIAATQERIDTLRDQLARWDDPAYVQAKARERLGWVVPGETGYVVVGADGRPVEGGSRIDSSRTDGEQPDADAWWARMAGSVEAADHPAPPPADEAVVDEDGE